MALFFLSGAVTAGDYIRINIATEATINQIFFMTDKLGWVATSDGEVLSTFDGGKTWKRMQVTSRAINDVQFQPRQGYIVGERGMIMKSTSGGASWDDISQNIKYNFVGVGIVNDTSIIVVGTDQNSMSKTKGIIFESWDGGKSWHKHPYHLGNGYTDIAVCRPNKVYLLASKKVFHSINNGQRYFHGEYEGSKLGFGFDFEESRGFMAGYEGLLAHSSDHGRNWEEIPIGVTKSLYAIESLDPHSGVAVGEDGLVVYVYDDGDRHVVESCSHEVDLRAVAVTSDKIFFGGDEGVLLYAERVPRTTGQKTGGDQ
jgi:photosystem II stability/assembly factor-like uncharacterized protein